MVPPQPANFKEEMAACTAQAGEDCLVGVDDDDVVATVNVGGEIGLQLAAEQVGGDDGGAAQGLTGGVKNVPLALHVFFSDQGSGHDVSSVYDNKYFDFFRLWDYNSPRQLYLYTTAYFECQALFFVFLFFSERPLVFSFILVYSLVFSFFNFSLFFLS